MACSALALGAANAQAGAAAAWSPQATPNPAGASSSVLSAVSCWSQTACTAVGHFTNRAGAGATLAERWNGSRWSIQRTVNSLQAASSLLFGVSCSSQELCTAVGSVTDRAGTTTVPLLERWTGNRWLLERTPTPAIRAALSYLGAVSCTSAKFCAAVGYSGNTSGTSGRPLAERWDGNRWSIQPIPRPPQTTVGFLSGVSCVSSSRCTATGVYVDRAGAAKPLAERWDGTRWSIQRVPNPAAAAGSQLIGVSCVRGGPCTTVGFFSVTGIEVMLAERWNGSSWTIQWTAYPAGALGVQLSGVSCASTRVCTAVGDYTDANGLDQMLAERWDGAKWSIQPTPPPPGATTNSLASVSCTSTTACMGVGGSANAAGTGVTLAERYS